MTLGEPKRVFKEGRINLIYRFASEGSPAVRLRVKIEINSREHFSELGLVKIPFQVESRWFQGDARVTTYTLDELLGTKLRALFQRKKGRDLFDLQDALRRGSVDPEAVIRCLRRYLLKGGHGMSRAQMEENLDAKRRNARFVGDIVPLLRPGTPWEPEDAMALVLEQFVARLPGAPWRGSGSSAR